MNRVWQITAACLAVAASVQAGAALARPLYDFQSDTLADGVSGLNMDVFQQCADAAESGALFSQPPGLARDKAVITCITSFSGGDIDTLQPQSPGMIVINLGKNPTDCTMQQYLISPQTDPNGALMFALEEHDLGACVTSLDASLETPGLYLADGLQRVNPSPSESASWYLAPGILAWNQTATLVQGIHGYGGTQPGVAAFPEWAGQPSIPYLTKRGGSAGCQRLTAEKMGVLINNTDRVVAAFAKQGIVFDGEGYYFMPVVLRNSR